uniref:Slc22a-6 n=1 Tax=Schmidtea mediterranea TaxID=79327 RepID=A0A0H3YJ98_SCHMD|nr:slc22a-6 [Schmidtea mediterranea]
MSEKIYQLVGGNSYFQYFILMFIFISQFNTAINILMPIFINNYQDVYCVLPKNQTNQVFTEHRNQFKAINNETGFLIIDSSRCRLTNISSICSEIFVKKYPMTSTIRSQFKLYCEYHALSSFATSMFMLGICLGSVFGGVFSDTFGRIIGCGLSYFMISVFSTVAAVSPWYTLHALGRLFTGFAVSVSFVSNSGMALEIVEISQRTNFGFYWSLGYDIGYLLLVLLAFFIRDHFKLQLACCCISYVSLIFPFFYKESFRWLLATKKYKKAKKVMMHIAKFNRKSVTENQIDKYIEIFEEERLRSVSHRVSIKEVFKYKVVLVNLLVLWFIFFSCSFSYYTFLLGSSKISDEIFTAALISALGSLVSRSIYMFLCKRLGRVTILLSLQLGVTALFIASIILKYIYGGKNIITTVLLMIAISVSGTNFGFMWIYGGEAFPTVIRATSVSIGSACARVSGMIASQMEWVFEIAPNVLPIIGMTMAMFGSLCTFFLLPETFKRPSSDFLSQAEKNFVEWRQPWRKSSKKIIDTEIKV